MQMRQLCPHVGQTQPSRRDLVTECASKFLESGGLLLLLGRALPFGRLCDDCHIREQTDATLEPRGRLLSFCCEAEFSVLAHGVAGFAAVRVEHILRDLLLALVLSHHYVQGCGGLLRGRQSL